jgi:hypothetical protein
MTHGDNRIGFLSGMIGGFSKLLIDNHFSLNIKFEPDFMIKLTEAGMTAFMCGCVGVLGKYFINWLIKKIKKK